MKIMGDPKIFCFGETASADVFLRLDDGTKFHAHKQLLRISVPWFATFFDTAVGKPGLDVELHEDQPRAWLLLLRRCYPPHAPISRYEDAMMLVPIVDKYDVAWLYDEVRSCLLHPLNTDLGSMVSIKAPRDECITHPWRRMLAMLPKPLQPGLRVLGQYPCRSRAGPPIVVGKVVRAMCNSDDTDGEIDARLWVDWEGIGEVEIEFVDINNDDPAIWLADYPGCPTDACLCWRHGFQSVVQDWFNTRSRPDRRMERIEFDNLAGNHLVLQHYIHSAKSIEVLRIAATTLQLHMSEAKTHKSDRTPVLGG